MDLIGYVTLAEANEYITTHYMSTEELRLGWEALADADRTVLLNRAFQSIELLPFRGRKLDATQQTAFPRWPVKEVPELVKYAQIEDALARSDSSLVADEMHYSRLRALGVSSYSVGSLSESLREPDNATGATQLSSTIAKKLLQPYLSGGYRL